MRFLIFVGLFLIACASGYLVHVWIAKPCGRIQMIVRWLLYLTWCLSWFPSMGGILVESPGKPDSPEMTVVRVLSFSNVFLFYVGGTTWLLLQFSRTRNVWLIPLSLFCFCFLSMIGPFVLMLAGGVLESETSDKPIPTGDDDRSREAT